MAMRLFGYLLWPSLGTLVGVGLTALFLGTQAAFILLVLLVLEVSLSFDNAVVNARVLEGLDLRWQRFFLTWGLIFPVFIVRFLGPLAVVSLSSGASMQTVLEYSLHDQQRYLELLEAAHPKILAFGGMFLLLVFFQFFFDKTKTVHWFRRIEQQLVRMGKIESVEIALALLILIGVLWWCPEETRGGIALAGMFGLVLNIVFGSLAKFFEEEPAHESGQSQAKAVSQRAAIAAVLYLELLDASFSLDGTVGAFAVTQNTWLIMTGLGLGALFIRSMTVMLVREKMLSAIIFLEHGAHYAIGVLGILMLASIHFHFSETVTGGIGLFCIGAALLDSWRYRRKSMPATTT